MIPRQYRQSYWLNLVYVQELRQRIVERRGIDCVWLKVMMMYIPLGNPGYGPKAPGALAAHLRRRHRDNLINTEPEKFAWVVRTIATR